MRHRFHAICPYFAMFPESFVRRNVLSWSEPGDVVFDPFCGRGTTVLESLLNNRHAIGCDVNPVAACVSRAKANPPSLDAVMIRIEDLKRKYDDEKREHDGVVADEFFRLCFHTETLSQLLFLRHHLNWRGDARDGFISAVILGVLHGESHRTAMCLSNRMPRTISTKPDYSVRWWKNKESLAPFRDTFQILRLMTNYRFASSPATIAGTVVEGDVRSAGEVFAAWQEQVKLVVTSPPYIDITDYREDQWLRLWFLGGHSRPQSTHAGSDDRHRNAERYWRFLQEAWSGIAPLLHRKCQLVIRIGGTRLSRAELSAGLQSTLETSLARGTSLAEMRTTDIVRGQRRAFTGSGKLKAQVEHDFRFVLSG
jgi:hypothetical protein